MEKWSLNEKAADEPNNEDDSSTKPSDVAENKLEDLLIPRELSTSTVDSEIQLSEGQTSSDNSTVSICRICQMGDDESGEALHDTECGCKGSVKRVHTSCLVQWVRQKGTNTCEICGGTYYVSPPPTPPHQATINIIQNWPASTTSSQSLNPTLERCLATRCVFVALVFFLMLVTGSAAAFTIQSFKALQTADDITQVDLHLQFLLCLCFLVLSGTATIIFLCSWIYLETSTHCRLVRRRRILEELGIMM